MLNVTITYKPLRLFKNPVDILLKKDQVREVCEGDKIEKRY
jgi:hypothetical protein